MLYFRNTELANTYHVSPRAVTNWIQATQKGKLNLELFQENGKSYVANTARNIGVIEKLVEERRKYRTSKAYKVISPKPEFYERFSPNQVIDIISNLEINREIPRQYNYFAEGAENWNEYAQRLDHEEVSNILNKTIKLLSVSRAAIMNLMVNFAKINVIDIGPGNGIPARDFLSYLLQSHRLGRYIAVDISPDILSITQKNIEKWFVGRVKVDAELRDITHERLSDIFSSDSFNKKVPTTNIGLLLGGTLGNFRDPEIVLKTLKESLGKDSLLLYSTKLDSSIARRYFDFNLQPGVSKLSPNHSYMVDVLNIDRSMFEVESGYDEKSRSRFIRIRLKVPLSLCFKQGGGERYVHLNKNDTVQLWRYLHQDTLELFGQFEHAGFELLHANTTLDGEYLLSIHRVKRADLD